jgi:hypothetical protein
MNFMSWKRNVLLMMVPLQLCLLLCFERPALAQGLNDDGSSLGAMMKLIEDELGRIGRVSYTIYLHDSRTGSNWKDQGNLYEISSVRAEGCKIAFHSFFEVGKALIGPSSRENDRSLSLLEVGK